MCHVNPHIAAVPHALLCTNSVQIRVVEKMWGGIFALRGGSEGGVGNQHQEKRQPKSHRNRYLRLLMAHIAAWALAGSCGSPRGGWRPRCYAQCRRPAEIPACSALRCVSRPFLVHVTVLIPVSLMDQFVQVGNWKLPEPRCLRGFCSFWYPISIRICSYLLKILPKL